MKKQDKIDALRKLKKMVQLKDFRSGMCLAVINLGSYYAMAIYKMAISDDQFEYLIKLIEKLLKTQYWIKNKNYAWKPGVKAPRIKWINEQIKKLEGKK